MVWYNSNKPKNSKTQKTMGKIRELRENLAEIIIKNKKRITEILIVLSLALFLSFIFEYFINGGRFSAEENRIIKIDEKDFKTEGVLHLEDGSFVSQKPKSSIILDTKGKYVGNLEISLGDESNYYIFVEYNDQATGEKKVLKNKLQKSMEKGGYDFLKLLVFNIDNSPEKIIVNFENPGTKVAGLVIDNNKYFNVYRFAFVFAACFLLSILFLIRKSIGEKPELAFLAVILICGSLISFSETKSFVSWDEYVHYKNADKISFKNIIRKDVDDVYAAANSVPHSYSIKEQQIINANFDGAIKEGVIKNKKSKFGVVELYNKIGYIPSAAALLLGRLLNIPAHLIFVMGRLANLFVYSLVVFLAIRKLKSGKMIMAVIALFPTAIFLASNYSYDPWVTAFSMLGLAYLFSELQQPESKIKVKDMIIMIGAFAIGFGPKAIYFPLMFLPYLLKKTKFGSPEQYKKFLFANTFAILFVLGSFMLPFVIQGPGDGDGRGGEAVNSTEQVRFMLSNPVVYTKILLNFLREYLNPFNYSGLVTSFAYLENIKGFFVLSIVFLIVIFTDKNEYDKITSKWEMKFLTLGVYFITAVLISTALYVAFTEVANPIIAGVQPRYLIPLIFPAAFVIGSLGIANRFNRNLYNEAIFTIIAAVLLGGIWDLIIKPYY